jgi:hypothetical protein
MIKHKLSDNFILKKLNDALSIFCNNDALSIFCNDYLFEIYYNLSNDNKIDDFSKYFEYETIQGVRILKALAQNEHTASYLKRWLLE